MEYSIHKKIFFTTSLLAIFCMFVMRFKSIICEDRFLRQTETILRGRRTGESPTVISVLRTDLGRSDLPYFFNSKSFFMRPENDEMDKSCPSCTMQQPCIRVIINDFFLLNTPEGHKQDLWEMFSAAVGSPDIDEWTSTQRSNLVFFYTVMINIVDQLHSIHLQQPQKTN